MKGDPSREAWGGSLEGRAGSGRAGGRGAQAAAALPLGLGPVLVLVALLAACASSEKKTGDRLAAQGKWDEAVAAYREAAKRAPFDVLLGQRLEQAKARAAEHHYREGRRLQQADQLLEAVEHYKMALGYDPSQSQHHLALADALRGKEARDHVQIAEKLQSLGRTAEAMDAYERAVELDPGLQRAREGITSLTEQQRADKMLGPSPQPITLRFQNAKLKEVLEILARAGGINLAFDKDLKDEPVTIFIKETPFHDALNLILSTNGLFARRIGPDTLLILPNTKQKQDQYQDLMIHTFYLSNAKAKDMVNLLRTMLESKRVYVNEALNAVVIRDQPEKLRLAERIILANDRRDSEVEFDVEVLEVNRTKSLKYGVNFAKTAGMAVVPPGSTAGVSANVTPYTFRQLTALGPSSYLFSLPSSVLLDFFKQESDAKTLASPKIRVLNNKQASVNIGEKQPILLSTTNVLPGQAATGAIPTTSTVTSIEFKDTGVKLTVEPTIHMLDELTLKLKIEVTRIGDQVTLQATPEIKQFRFGTRTAETTLNMKNDETIVLAGLIQDEDRKSVVTVPGLGDIPILGQLFRSTATDTITTEVMLTITPHIVRNVTTPTAESQAFWSGTETTYATQPLFSASGSSSGREWQGEARSRRRERDHGPPDSPFPASPGPLGSGLPAAPAASAGGNPPPAAAGPADPGVTPGEVTVLALRPAEIIAFPG